MICAFRSPAIRPLLNTPGHYRKTNAVVAVFVAMIRNKIALLPPFPHFLNLLKNILRRFPARLRRAVHKPLKLDRAMFAGK
jgi:hypothetical protein